MAAEEPGELIYMVRVLATCVVDLSLIPSCPYGPLNIARNDLDSE